MCVPLFKHFIMKSSSFRLRPNSVSLELWTLGELQPAQLTDNTCFTPRWAASFIGSVAKTKFVRTVPQRRPVRTSPPRRVRLPPAENVTALQRLTEVLRSRPRHWWQYGWTACAFAHVVSTSALMMLCRKCRPTTRFNHREAPGAARACSAGRFRVRSARSR